MKELFTEALKFLNNIWTIFERSGKVMKKISNVFDNMHSMINNDSQISQVLIMVAHNNHKRLSVSTHSFVSCLHEAATHPFKSVKSDFQRIPLDRSYATILSRLVDDKKITIETSKLEDGSLMKSMFESQHIVKAQFHFLKDTRKYFYFATCVTSNHNVTLEEPDTDLTTRIAISKIKELIN